MQFPDSDFWDFSIRFYTQPEVENHCLSLQEKYQLDVNSVLFAFWLASEKNTVLNVQQWHQLLSVSLPWQEIIKPLRKSRVLLKDAAIAWPADFQHETRGSISQIEINAEHMQQLAMEKYFSEMSPEPCSMTLDEMIRCNLSNLLGALNQDTSLGMIEAEISPLLEIIQNDQDSKKIIA